MINQFARTALLWGCLLWLIGYILGIALFPLVPSYLLGWIIMPIGTVITLWVLAKKVTARSFRQYLFLAFTWTLIAVVLDYFLLVKLIKPPDGYYKLDVYLYYALTFAIPLLVWWGRSKRRASLV